MERGLLANILNIPPLIFRFQYNPEILQEKKRFKYQQASSYGQWVFDQTTGAQGGAFNTLSGLWEDLKEIGPLLTRTKPYEPLEGEPRKYSLEFKLDAMEPGPMDIGDHFGGSIEPDLAVLRSFMYPAFNDLDVVAFLGNGIFKQDWKLPCWSAPPLCTLVYGPLSFDCIMEDLDIKITDFKEDLSPLRAEVKVSLAEQTHSTTPIVDFITRNLGAGRALGREGIGDDFEAASPIVVPLIRSLGNLFG
jgi:hypothetical protein